jgi:UDP-N-acetylenolpyruvoylglucosamine reductase
MTAEENLIGENDVITQLTVMRYMRCSKKDASLPNIGSTFRRQN